MNSVLERTLEAIVEFDRGDHEAENNLQRHVANLLEYGPFGLDGADVEAVAAPEDARVYTELATGDGTGRRIDIVRGATLIETKARLASSHSSQSFQDAEKQLRGYLENRLEVDGRRFNGILTDGHTWFLYEIQPDNGAFEQVSKVTFSSVDDAEVLFAWLGSLMATDRGTCKVSPANIEARLGYNSAAYKADSEYLMSLYNKVKDDPTVALKRSLWARLMRSALGTGFDTDDKLFINHTLLVCEAVIRACQVFCVSGVVRGRG